MIKQHIFSVLVENQPGVLQRVASMFARRGFNIDSITVGPTDNEDIARMTIVTTGSDKTFEQIIKQMNKIVNVIKVIDLLRDKSVCRELCLVKVHTKSEKEKSEVIQYTDVFRGRIVDVSRASVIAEITGETQKIDAFVDLVRPIGIKEIARTGVTAMQRGGE